MDVDTWLLERTFQPIADRLEPLLDCFGLARLSLAAAVVLQTAVLACDFSTFSDPLRITIAVGAAVLAYGGADAARAMIGRAARGARRGTMNVYRITLRPQRLAWLLVAPGAVAFLLPEGGLRSAFQIGAALGWVAVVYFASCTPAPPRAAFGRFSPAFG